MVALFDARRTGVGRDVDTNLYDAALAMLTYPATWYMSAGVEPGRQPNSGHPSVVPFQFFATLDGHVAVAAPKEKFFRALVERMGLERTADDPRFASFEARRQNREELIAVLSARFAEEPNAVWLERLRGHVPIAPIRPMEAALDLEELRDRDMLAVYEHPVFGTVRSVGLPLKMGGFTPTYAPGPGLGADGAAILAELNASSDQLESS